MNRTLASEAAEVVAHVVAGRRGAALLAAAAGHDLAPGQATAETIDNNLRRVRAGGAPAWSLVLLLEHLTPGTAARLLPHYAHRTGTGRAPGIADVVRRIDDSIRACAACLRPEGVRLDPEALVEVVDLAARRRLTGPQRPSPRSGAGGGRLTLVTAISGLDIDTALARVPPSANGPRTIVTLDDHFAVLTTHFLRRLGLDQRRPHEPPLRQAFQLNARILKDCWRYAIRSAVHGEPVGIPEVDRVLARLDNVVAGLAQGDVFLRIRMTWFDVVAHGFTFAGDLPALVEALAAIPAEKRLVAAIDDIWDTFRRLMRPGGAYNYLLSEPDRPIVDDLLRVMEWRRLEVLFSEAIAPMLGIDCVIVPMKIPMRTFQAIVDGDASVFYLSYSVGYLYRDRIGKASRAAWQSYVLAIARELEAASEGTVVGVPATAVDEYRLRLPRGRDRNGGHVRLRERWPVRVDPDEHLFAPDLWPGEDAFVADPFRGRPETPRDLEPLQQHLRDLVQARGRALARQSLGVILLRPFPTPEGSLPLGMDIVSDQNRQLVAYPSALPPELADAAPRRLPAIVFHPRDDEHTRRLAALRADCHRTLQQWDVYPAWRDRAVRNGFDRALRQIAPEELDLWHEWTEPRQFSARISEMLGHRNATRSDTIDQSTIDGYAGVLKRRIRRALEVSEHKRPLVPAREHGVPALRDAVFVTADSTRSASAEAIALGLLHGIGRAQHSECGTFDVDTGTWTAAPPDERVLPRRAGDAGAAASSSRLTSGSGRTASPAPLAR